MYSLNQSQIGQMSLVGQLGGMFSSAIGSYFSADMQKSNLKFQADMAEINARMSEQSAQSALLQGQRQASAISMRAGQIKSGQRVALAANGIDLGSGNAAETQASTDIMKQIDMQTAEANAVRTAFGYRTQAVNQQNSALMARASAGAISPFGSAATSLLGSATSVAGNWYQMNKLGLFDSPSNGSAGGGSGLSLSQSGEGLRMDSGVGLKLGNNGIANPIYSLGMRY